MYWAVAGGLSLPNTQTFQAIIPDHNFYNEHIYKFALYKFYCSDETKRPVLHNPAEAKAHEKKLLGLAIEKQVDCMIAFCPKCYISFNCYDNTNTINENIKVIARKIKGVSLKENKHITPESYCQCLVNGVKFDD